MYSPLIKRFEVNRNPQNSTDRAKQTLTHTRSSRSRWTMEAFKAMSAAGIKTTPISPIRNHRKANASCRLA